MDCFVVDVSLLLEDNGQQITLQVKAGEEDIDTRSKDQLCTNKPASLQQGLHMTIIRLICPKVVPQSKTQRCVKSQFVPIIDCQ